MHKSAQNNACQDENPGNHSDPSFNAHHGRRLPDGTNLFAMAGQDLLDIFLERLEIFFVLNLVLKDLK